MLLNFNYLEYFLSVTFSFILVFNRCDEYLFTIYSCNLDFGANGGKLELVFELFSLLL